MMNIRMSCDSLLLASAVGLLVAGAMPGCSAKPASKTHLTKLRKSAEKKVAKVRADIKVWRTEIRKLLKGKLPVTDKPCPSEYRSNLSAGRIVLRPGHSKNLDKMTPEGHLMLLSRYEAARGVAGPNSKLPPKIAKQRLRALERPHYDKAHATLVVHQELKPKLVDKKTYAPGFIKGRVLVWSYKEARFVCATEIEEHTPKKMLLKGRWDHQEKLIRKLEVNAMLTAERKLRSLR